MEASTKWGLQILQSRLRSKICSTLSKCVSEHYLKHLLMISSMVNMQEKNAELRRKDEF